MLALGIIFGFTSFALHAAYGHGCRAHGCGCLTPGPTAALPSYSEVVHIVSAVGTVLIMAMIIFKFEYLQHRDFCAVRYGTAANRIHQILFKGRDKRKIIAAIPVLTF